MKQSIESIWKEGFLNQNAEIVPKINDIYNRKSVHIIDKLTRMKRWNFILIYGFSFGLFLFSFIDGFPNGWTAISLMFAFLAAYGQNRMKDLDTVDKTQNSYTYLKQFDLFIKKMIKEYTTIYRVFYPLLIIFLFHALRYSEAGEKLMEIASKEFPNMPMLYGEPLYFIVFVAVLSLTMIFLAKPLYMLDIKIVYGNMFRRLEETLSDMEELQKEL